MSDADADLLNVLVIDDDDKIRQILQRLISREGHQVIAVASAEEGLELLPVWTFQVAFLDQNLPGMDGLVLGEYLRRNNPDVSLALITGDGSRAIERRSRDLSITYIAKPFRAQEILKVIDAYRTLAAERVERRRRRLDPDFGPSFGRYLDELAKSFGVPNVPGRVQEALIETVKRALNDLRSATRYSERERVVALSGLLTMGVLGIPLPKTNAGLSLFEEYDRLMREHGRRSEFER